MRSRAVSLLVASLGFVALVAPAWAHHSNAMYDPDKLIAYEGVVTDVQWRNPHMLVSVDVPNASGKMENWQFEGAGAAATAASGISFEMLKPGKRVKIIGRPHKDPTKHEAIFMGVEHNGKFYARGGGATIKGDEAK